MLPFCLLLATLHCPSSPSTTPRWRGPRAEAPGGAAPLVLRLDARGARRRGRPAGQRRRRAGAAGRGDRPALGAADLRYGKNPDLWASYNTPLAAPTSRSAAGGPVGRGGDERMRVVARTRSRPRHRADQRAPRRQPAAGRRRRGSRARSPAPPFEAGATFAQRGRPHHPRRPGLLAWSGSAPEVTLQPPWPAPTTKSRGSSGSWTLEPDTRLIELVLAGPPATPTVDESAFREGFQRGRTCRPRSSSAGSRVPRLLRRHQAARQRLWYALWARSTSCGCWARPTRRPRLLRPALRPPGQRRRLRPEVRGRFADWAFGDWAVTFHAAAGGGRGARRGRCRRRGAWRWCTASRAACGWARQRRLRDAGSGHPRAHGRDAEGAEVRPWLDPALVRRTCRPSSTARRRSRATCCRSSRGPRRRRAARGARSGGAARAQAHDGARAWALLPRSWPPPRPRASAHEPRGMPDGLWPLGMASLIREMFFDDHGESCTSCRPRPHAGARARRAQTRTAHALRHGAGRVHIAGKKCFARRSSASGVGRASRARAGHVPPGFAAGSLSTPPSAARPRCCPTARRLHLDHAHPQGLAST